MEATQRRRASFDRRAVLPTRPTTSDQFHFDDTTFFYGASTSIADYPPLFKLVEPLNRRRDVPRQLREPQDHRFLAAMRSVADGHEVHLDGSRSGHPTGAAVRRRRPNTDDEASTASSTTSTAPGPDREGLGHARPPARPRSPCSSRRAVPPTSTVTRSPYAWDFTDNGSVDLDVGQPEFHLHLQRQLHRAAHRPDAGGKTGSCHRAGRRGQHGADASSFLDATERRRVQLRRRRSRTRSPAATPRTGPSTVRGAGHRGLSGTTRTATTSSSAPAVRRPSRPGSRDTIRPRTCSTCSATYTDSGGLTKGAELILQPAKLKQAEHFTKLLRGPGGGATRRPQNGNRVGDISNNDWISLAPMATPGGDGHSPTGVSSISTGGSIELAGGLGRAEPCSRPASVPSTGGWDHLRLHAGHQRDGDKRQPDVLPGVQALGGQPVRPGLLHAVKVRGSAAAPSTTGPRGGRGLPARQRGLREGRGHREPVHGRRCQGGPVDARQRHEPAIHGSSSAGNGAFRPQAVHSSKCLDVSGALHLRRARSWSSGPATPTRTSRTCSRRRDRTGGFSRRTATCASKCPTRPT